MILSPIDRFRRTSDRHRKVPFQSPRTTGREYLRPILTLDLQGETGHGAQNILNGEISPSKNWMCEKGTEKAVVILQLQRAAVLTSVHVGNAHSAFVEVLVGKAADSSDQFESLIPMSVFMNPHESKTSSNPNRTRFFKKPDFNELAAGKSWDRIKVVCSQPFNRHVPFGLCFLEVHGEKEAKKVEIPKKDEGNDEIEVGSFFRKKRSSGGEKPLTVGQQIKEAEKETSLAQHTPLSISKISEKFSSDRKQKGDEGERRKKPEEKAAKRKKEEGNSENKEGTPVKRKKEEKTEHEKKKAAEGKPRKRRKKPFEKLLEDVVLVISGFKNPLRGDIRSMALRMGAKYSGDWEPHCTHLVCAYENTPKARQVKGKGKIVKKEWVERCHEDRKRYPWRRFALDKTESNGPESEEEIDAGEESEPEEVASCSNAEAVSTPEKKKTGAECYDVATDDEEEKTVDTTYYPMPFLPDVLSLKTFYVDPNLNGRASVERYIIAYKGILSKSFNEDVDFYVTDTGGASVELFRKKAPNVVAVKPSWIWEINAKQKFVPTSPHIVR